MKERYIDLVSRVSRVDRSRGVGHYSGAAAACLKVSVWDSVYSPSSVLTSPASALLHAPQLLNGEATGWTFSRESMPHLTGSTAGGWPAGFVTFVVFFPTPLGFPPPNVESNLLKLTQSFLDF